jgi:asparagine synthase (glutamine-hydrolysing)
VVPGEWDTGDAIAWLGLNALARGQRRYAQMARSCGVNLHAPYLDDSVVRAAWSVPTWIRTSPERYKPLLAAAVRGLVPDRLLNRRTKGDYTRLAYLGLGENADALADLLTDSRLGELGLLEEQKVVAELRRAGAGLPIRLGAFDGVVGMEMWLRSLDTTAGGHPRAW